jgi:(1->4)-alpha-D-glucan 1-alpha-D-glucosylmutase
VGLERKGGWGDTALDLGGPATDAISGRRVPREVLLADLLAAYPVALLVR